MSQSILCSQPYITVYNKLFAIEDCKFVIENCGSFNKSMAYGSTIKFSEVRTSSTYPDFDGKFDYIREKLFHTIKSKFWYLDEFTIDNLEFVKVLKYNEGEQFKPHHDYFGSKVTDNDRIATVIVYLNDDFTGGDTVFNELGLTVRPNIGSALFFDYKYIDELNQKTLHEGTPVLSGTKYIATVWIRRKPWEYSDGP
jgi:prolyl 4-hydroxylase